MALSMEEQRILDAMEHKLADDDPRLASRLTTFGQPRLLGLAGSGRARIDIGSEGEIGLAADAASGGRATLLQLLLVIRDAQIDGTWPRLKVCHNEACRWAFYDRSHTRQGRWCDMAVCGNRIKNRNLRQRRR